MEIFKLNAKQIQLLKTTTKLDSIIKETILNLDEYLCEENVDLLIYILSIREKLKLSSNLYKKILDFISNSFEFRDLSFILNYGNYDFLENKDVQTLKRFDDINYDFEENDSTRMLVKMTKPFLYLRNKFGFSKKYELDYSRLNAIYEKERFEKYKIPPKGLFTFKMAKKGWWSSISISNIGFYLISSDLVVIRTIQGGTSGSSKVLTEKYQKAFPNSTNILLLLTIDYLKITGFKKLILLGSSNNPWLGNIKNNETGEESVHLTLENAIKMYDKRIEKLLNLKKNKDGNYELNLKNFNLENYELN